MKLQRFLIGVSSIIAIVKVSEMSTVLPRREKLFVSEQDLSGSEKVPFQPVSVNSFRKDCPIRSPKPMSCAFDSLNKEGSLPFRFKFCREVLLHNIAKQQDFVSDIEGLHRVCFLSNDSFCLI